MLQVGLKHVIKSSVYQYCIQHNLHRSQRPGFAIHRRKKQGIRSDDHDFFLFNGNIGGSIGLRRPVFFGKPILQLMGVTPNLLSHAEVYIRIVGSMMFMQAILNLSTVIMRTHGYSKETLGITAGMNVINVVGDILFVFGFNMGAAGAAYATCIGRFVAMLMAVRFVRRRILDKGPFRYIRNFPCGSSGSLQSRPAFCP